MNETAFAWLLQSGSVHITRERERERERERRGGGGGEVREGGEV